MSDDFFSNVIAMFKHFRSNIYDFLHVDVDEEHEKAEVKTEEVKTEVKTEIKTEVKTEIKTEVKKEEPEEEAVPAIKQ